MNGRRAIVGLCMLCALLVSAFAAQSASAITGTTGFTCVKGGGEKTLRGTHCLTTGTKPQEYGHLAIEQDKTTEAITTNANTESETTTSSIGRLRVTIAGVPLELSATGASGVGWGENRVAANGEHYGYGEGTTTFTGVEVTQPAGRGCQVYTHKEAGGGSDEGEVGVIHTRQLKATSQGLGDSGKLEAADGANFANFWITCTKEPKIPAIEGTWSCSGSIKSVPNGATIFYSHAETTAQNTLKCKGTKTGVEIKTTGGGREKGSTGAYAPVAATTVAT
ncbi:MAG TPA: hypothetical protein VF081_12045 [Solirubrobacterales bacterium]